MITNTLFGSVAKHLCSAWGAGCIFLADADVNEHHSLGEAAKKIPHGVICLQSSLRFHGLTTQAPFEVWIVVDVKARKPGSDDPPLRIVRFSGAALSSGIGGYPIQGVAVKVYGIAKTVADCFDTERPPKSPPGNGRRPWYQP